MVKKIENDQVSQLDLNGWGRVKGVKKWGLKKIKWVDGNKEVQRVLTHFREKITLWHVQLKLFTGTWKSCIVQIFYRFCKIYAAQNTLLSIEIHILKIYVPQVHVVCGLPVIFSVKLHRFSWHDVIYRVFSSAEDRTVWLSH